MASEYTARGRTWRVLLGAVVAAGLGAVLALVAPAGQAAFPGTNGKIVFMGSRFGGDTDILSINPDGSGLTDLTNNSVQDMQPDVSADGSKIVFSSSEDGDTEIFSMNADGSNRLQLTHNSGDDQTPAWSPDGTKIAFWRAPGGLYVMNADGTGAQLIVSGDSTPYPEWSPDGTKIVFYAYRDGNNDIYVVPASGGAATRLTTDPALDLVPDWSPDGTKIAFMSDRVCNPYCYSQIWVMNADGTGQTALTSTSPNQNEWPAWSPDGTKIAFARSNTTGGWDLFTMNADGTDQTLLTTGGTFNTEPDWATAVGGPPLAITGVTPLTGSVGRYERFEASIDLSETFANPFDPDQIAVDVTFTAPSGRTEVVPAFWYEPFTASGTDWETYTSAGDPEWRVRFAPDEVGTYTYSVAAVAGSSTATPVTGSFDVTSSSSDGFVRADGDYLRFDDGNPYIPVGHNVAFEDSNPKLNGVGFYTSLFDSLGRAGENWSRVWMTDFNRSALEWGEGHYSGFYHGPGVYSLPSAWRMDKILELAEQDGVYVQLVLNDFGQFSNRGGDRWGVRCDTPPCEPGDPGYDPGNAYSDANGGPVPLADPELAFSNAEARDLMKQRLRYVVARWGAYRSVLAWELMNEMQFVGSDAANPYTSAQVRSDLVSWHADLADYLEATDPFGHLVTTSAAIKDSDGALTQLNDVWALPSVDLVQVHWYEQPPAQTTTALSAWVDELRDRYDKPVLVGELGLPAPNPEPDFDPTTFSGSTADREHLEEGTYLHNAMWSTAVSGSGSMYWWWGNYIAADSTRNRTAPDFPLNERLVPPLTSFLSGTDWASLGLTQADITTSGPVVAVGSSNGDRAYLWARDAENEYGSGSRPGDLAGRSVAGATLTLPMDDGVYDVHVFDTWGNGGETSTFSAVATGGSLTVALPTFTRDVALELEWVGDVPSTPCGDAPNASPSDAGSPVTLTFVNQSGAPVEVYWLDYAGVRQLWFTLDPGQSLAQDTYETNVWLALDSATGECLGWASGSDGELDIGGTAEPPPVDTDGDGLYDTWETNGIDVDGDGTVDLPLNQAPFNADPRHKDVFLEVDYMAANAPQTGALADVEAAFAAAPVSNPDGTTGVRLHAMLGEQVPTYATVCFWDCATYPAPISFDALKRGDPETACDGYFGTPAERSDASCAAILAARRLVFRYAVFAADYSERPGSSGVAELWGNDLMITLGSAYSSWIAATGNLRAAEAGTLMHELGHTLGLGHGGGDEINCKPNYQSVMTYTRQVPNVDPSRPLDYSSEELPELDEALLDETLGIDGPSGSTVIWGVGGVARVAPGDDSVDWDGNGSFDEDVAADVNHIGTIGDCGASPDQVLQGHDDWSSLRYGFRTSPNFGEGAVDPPRQAPVPELTAATALDTAEAADSDGDGASNASEAICSVTRDDVQGSVKWQGARPVRRAAATVLVDAACKAIEAIGPDTGALRKRVYLAAYRGAVRALRAGRWITPSQARELEKLAATL